MHRSYINLEERERDAFIAEHYFKWTEIHKGTWQLNDNVEKIDYIGRDPLTGVMIDVPDYSNDFNRIHIVERKFYEEFGGTVFIEYIDRILNTVDNDLYMLFFILPANRIRTIVEIIKERLK